MFLLEWGFWQMATESETERNKTDQQNSRTDKKDDNKFYQGDLDQETHFNPVSENPRTRGPVFVFNDTYFEMRCGGSEEKRGLITLMTLGAIAPTINAWTALTYGFLKFNLSILPDFNILIITLNILSFLAGSGILYLYLKYGLRFTRLEMCSSRHLLIRFNRKTQQVHLHRPTNCGGIVTFPWKTTGSTAIYPEDDSLSVGMRL
ncbi:MAG: hypothetical protein ACN6OX_14880, partial [Pseudomonas sp.]